MWDKTLNKKKEPSDIVADKNILFSWRQDIFSPNFEQQDIFFQKKPTLFISNDPSLRTNMMMRDNIRMPVRISSQSKIAIVGLGY